MKDITLVQSVVLSRLAGRAMVRLHDQFGRAQGLAPSDYPFGHADLCHVLDDLDEPLANDRLSEDVRRDVIGYAIRPLLDLASGPGSWPDLDRAVVHALVDALHEGSGYAMHRIEMIR